ncbi:hypothetical protein OGAPHI_006440 [Ogataea philodendri]|uniref:Uncharacterized protein n=1 Tax=Ogataea philodendri TaxID=1378263 RepID=A0A9P8NXX3_9ASCO|nr:uncharacterized protein OGAPHI_006440 [Ogataea philodendri]KAH3661592.1 hypothetical protein OGAPHI_006440 [Ogataea philodendri]
MPALESKTDKQARNVLCGLNGTVQKSWHGQGRRTSHTVVKIEVQTWNDDLAGNVLDIWEKITAKNLGVRLEKLNGCSLIVQDGCVNSDVFSGQLDDVELLVLVELINLVLINNRDVLGGFCSFKERRQNTRKVWDEVLTNQFTDSAPSLLQISLCWVFLAG